MRCKFHERFTNDPNRTGRRYFSFPNATEKTSVKTLSVGNVYLSELKPPFLEQSLTPCFPSTVSVSFSLCEVL